MDAPHPTTIVCDVGAYAPNAITVAALARLQLGAGRLGHELRLRGATPDLIALIAFVGLGDVLRVEVEGEPEEREQDVGVEEERELDDPAL
jgi:hypothetical protein